MSIFWAQVLICGLLSISATLFALLLLPCPDDDDEWGEL